MAIKRYKTLSAYGIDNALQRLAPQPIYSSRIPTTSDIAEIGTLCVTVAGAYYVSQGGGVWIAQATGSGTFAAVNVTGAVGTTLQVTADTSLGGTLTVGGNTGITGNLAVTGDVTITGDFDITDTEAISLTSTKNAANAIYLHANGGASETIRVYSDQGTGLNSVNLLSDVGGILLQSTGKADVKAINLVASAGGITLDGVLSSTWNVVGASQDVSLASAGGSINLTATEAAADAINIQASDAAGGIVVGYGTGALTVTGANGAFTVATGTGTVGISADAAATTVNVATGAGAKTATFGSTNTTSTTAIHSGIGTLTLQGQAIVSIAAVTNLQLQGGGTSLLSLNAGQITLTGSNAVISTIDVVGGFELNSTGGALSIGNDADNQAVNVGTAGVRTVTVGNVTGASATNINAGTGGITLGAAGKVVVTPATDTQASPTAASTINVNVGVVKFTGFTTAAAATQVFTITNALVSATSGILCTVGNTGANDAQMHVTRVTPGVGSFTVTALNGGAAALNGNVIISFWVIN